MTPMRRSSHSAIFVSIFSWEVFVMTQLWIEIISVDCISFFLLVNGTLMGVHLKKKRQHEKKYDFS